ncbi:MAG: glucoamylase family protein [Proteiniphilum sp.]|nr:glucoamylase family protein [Proteiniphilum sp.]MDD4800013.1 glucoamylase family protein [Proteiniphilum sp.]
MNKATGIGTGIICAAILWSCGKSDEEKPPRAFHLETMKIEGVVNAPSYHHVDPAPVIALRFSEPVDPAMLEANITLRQATGEAIQLIFTLNQPSLLIEPADPLEAFTAYQLEIRNGLRALSGNQILTGKVYPVTTGLDPSDKFPRIPDEELLTLVQRQTFRYFWEFAHPVSGMARERTTSGNTVTTGGTGFGVMAMIVATERAFITREEALLQVQKIVSFLEQKATRYHGAFAHWIHGETGATIPFSTYDNGADLVETALLFQGLLTARQYFDRSTAAENILREGITRLWKAVEWDWFRKENEPVLYWHWSPLYGWQMNMPIAGWNESLIAYVLAASSPTHPITREVYEQGWARNGTMVNNGTYYGYRLPLGPALGGPLFFAHYSFLGIRPKGLRDRYADYWEQNRNHSLINYRHCVDNPDNYYGYSDHCWGLTASDGDQGYNAHSPVNDRGVIAPTAALSSMPYTPEESMRALRFFYYKLGDRLWTDYGFADAFNLSEGWFDNQQIAINQGPIILMIENYRSALLWNLLMNDPDVQAGLAKLDFQWT